MCKLEYRKVAYLTVIIFTQTLLKFQYFFGSGNYYIEFYITLPLSIFCNYTLCEDVLPFCDLIFYNLCLLFLGSPDEWLTENVATLLYLCGECITVKVLSSKAINGRMCELANLITSLSLVCI